MSEPYSKTELKHFLDLVVSKGLVNPNTGNGWKAAFSRIFENVQDSDDVREVDVKTEVRRYNNAHPGELGPSSLDQYERRMAAVIREFQLYKENPSKYKGLGRHPSGIAKKKGTAAEKTTLKSGSSTALGAASVPESAQKSGAGLSFNFPLRVDFLAQIVVPRDMKLMEARRLTSFILTLAQDFQSSDDGRS